MEKRTLLQGAGCGLKCGNKKNNSLDRHFNPIRMNGVWTSGIQNRPVLGDSVELGLTDRMQEVHADSQIQLFPDLMGRVVGNSIY